MSNTVYLSTEDVAERLKLSVETVRRLCSNGTLPAVKLGRSYRVVEADMDGFMRKHRGSKTPAAQPDRVKRGRLDVA